MTHVKVSGGRYQYFDANHEITADSFETGAEFNYILSDLIWFNI